ncbi:MAG: hypothetical protein DIZ80_07070 [endosymbiont of Galathealinum brachiosum]|uniref:Phosphohistidine phosphatase n=1 Tax=endosymbiont of Galathealinum brachiosum TaxID=2200906 RepID=A0A370DH75_9GAMM|nr:MAG: hypothetical protein DIZ80_07070 [endosymbiont of Galathealinum brachiosum]
MKTVLFARHAKSNWGQEGISDFERPLNSQGEVDAPAMASYLEQCGYVIHQILSSDAARAMATATEYKNHLTPQIDILTEHSLYLASHLDIADVVKNISAKNSTVMIVGHNPGMSEIVDYYVDGSVDDMPTCSVAIVQFDVSNWKDVKVASGDLLAFEYPKKLI